MQFFLSAMDSWVLAKSLIPDEQKAYQLAAQAILLTHLPASAVNAIPTDLFQAQDDSAAAFPDTVMLSEILALLECEVSIPPTIVITTLIDAINVPMNTLAQQLKAPESLLNTYLGRGRSAGHGSRALDLRGKFSEEKMHLACKATPKASATAIRQYISDVKSGKIPVGSSTHSTAPSGAQSASSAGNQLANNHKHAAPTGFESSPVSLSAGEAASELQQQSATVGATTFTNKPKEAKPQATTEVAGMQFACEDPDDNPLDLPPFPLDFYNNNDGNADPQALEANAQAQLAANSRSRIQEELQVQNGPDGTYFAPGHNRSTDSAPHHPTIHLNDGQSADYFADITSKPNRFVDEPPKQAATNKFDTGFSTENRPNHGFLSQTYPDQKPLLSNEEVVVMSRNVGPHGLATSSTTLIRPQKERAASFKGAAENEEQNTFALAFIVVFVTLFIGVLVFILVYALQTRTSVPDTMPTIPESTQSEHAEKVLVPQTTPVEPGHLVIEELQLLKGENEDITTERTFTKTERLAFAVAYSKGAENDNVTAVTLQDGKEIHREMVWLNPWLTTQYFLADPNKLYFDVGNYQIQIIQNGEVVQDLSFTITE